MELAHFEGHCPHMFVDQASQSRPVRRAGVGSVAIGACNRRLLPGGTLGAGMHGPLTARFG
jgi:hypothetical protein